MNVARAAGRTATIKESSRGYYESLGRRLAQLRTSRGYTQSELARRLGVSQQTIFAYEIGERRVPVIVLERIAKLFAVSVDQLMGVVPVRPIRKRRLSPRAIRHAERIQGLSKTAQRFVVRIIDQIEATGSYASKRSVTQALETRR